MTSELHIYFCEYCDTSEPSLIPSGTTVTDYSCDECLGELEDWGACDKYGVLLKAFESALENEPVSLPHPSFSDIPVNLQGDTK